MSAGMARILAIHPVMPARNVAESIRFYRQLGFELSFQDLPREPNYVGMRRDGIELHLQWADAGQWVEGVDRPACRFVVDDVDALHARLVVMGAVNTASSDGSPWASPADTPWGTREFHVRDPGGNSLQFYAPR